MARLEFPLNFKWGVSQSGFQFEMGDPYRRYIDAGSDWWMWVRDPYNVSVRVVSGDLPEDGIDYLELYRKDHGLAHDLGLNIYRLGVEWSRVFPHPTEFVSVNVSYDGNGFVRYVDIDDNVLKELDKLADADAVNLYREVLIDLRSLGFKVMVNLSHFTLPKWLHNPLRARESGLSKGPLGLLSNSYPVEFAKFAAYIAWRFGDLVDMWSTMNEPIVPLGLGYMDAHSGFPPGVKALDKVPEVLSNLAIAHALAYDAIKKFDTYVADPDSRSPAEVGIIYNIVPAYGLDDGGMEAARNYSYFHNKVFLNAVVEGKLDTQIDGMTVVKPPALGGKLDWLGVNYYTRLVVKEERGRFGKYRMLNFKAVPGYGHACTPNGLSKIGRWCDDMGWEHYPEGLRDALRIASKYSSKIYVTENGTSDARDVYRPSCIVNHLYVLHELLDEGLSVNAYMHWALTDNYEWAKGFRQRFGLYGVNLVTKDRIPRPSSKIYGEIAHANELTKESLKHLTKIKAERR